MNDRVYPVAYAPRRTSRHWKNDTVTWDQICNWVRNPIIKDTKETGNYILARLGENTKVHAKGEDPCTNTHRDNQTLVERSALIALDSDHPEEGFDLRIEAALHAVRYVLHTTWSSTPEDPRYRLIVAVDRPMQPFEYCEAAEALASRMGRENFDPSTFEAARFMFKPGHPTDSHYEHVVNEGKELSVDTLVDEYALLTPTQNSKSHKNKRDPFELPDPAGAFNRAYQDLQELVDEYDLPYEPEGDRWRLTGTHSMAGMGPIKDAPGLFQSHHAGDPAAGQACSAFDLVRLHRFAELDESAPPATPVNRLPSHDAMCALASIDRHVVDEIFSDHPDLQDDTKPSEPNWRSKLSVGTRTGRMLNDVKNWDLLREHDPVFKKLRRNEMKDTVEFTDGRLPWRTVTPMDRPVRKDDRTEFVQYLQRVYKIQDFARQEVQDMVNATARLKEYHPVREYLAQLRWDGTPRIHRCLPGVRPSHYAGWVARKCLTAAVARIFEPGCFWDHCLVLHGGEGIGKSKWVSTLARGYSGGLPSKIDSTDALRVLHQNWIAVSDEGHSMRRADFEALKDFITRAEDQYRLPYETDFTFKKRQSVIWSTTNDKTFLRNEVGNRRFLVVHCEDPVDFKAMTDQYVDQLWAEAVDIYLGGDEMLFLDPIQVLEASEVRASFTEENPIAGYVQSYVARLVPEDWETLDRFARLDWMATDAVFNEGGTDLMNRVCSTEITEVVFGKKPGEAQQVLITQVTNALKDLPDWYPEGVVDDGVGYGSQLMFVRKGSLL